MSERENTPVLGLKKTAFNNLNLNNTNDFFSIVLKL